MTEAPTTTQDQAETTKPDVASLPPMAKMVLDQLSTRFSRITKISATQEKVGDVGKLLSEAVEASTDPEIVKARKAVEQFNQKILDLNKAMEAKVKPTLNVPSDEELAKLDEEYKDLASQINTYNGVFQAEVKQQGEHPDLTVFDYFGNLPGKKRGSKPGANTGISRPRVSTIEYTEDVNGVDGWHKAEKDGKSTFSVLSQILKSATDGKVDASASDFNDAWTSQNHVTDWQKLNDVTTFIYDAGPAENGKQYRWMVRVTK